MEFLEVIATNDNGKLCSELSVQNNENRSLKDATPSLRSRNSEKKILQG